MKKRAKKVRPALRAVNPHRVPRARKAKRTAFSPCFTRRYWLSWRRDGAPSDPHHAAWSAGRPRLGNHFRRPVAPMRDPARIRGQAITEYVLLWGALVVALLVGDLVLAEPDRSAIRFFMDSVGGFYKNALHVVCLPLP